MQVCWHKFARYWDIELVVPTLRVTFTGQYELVEEVCKVLDDFEKQIGLDIPVHVDAVSGGFLAPFIDPDLK